MKGRARKIITALLAAVVSFLAVPLWASESDPGSWMREWRIHVKKWRASMPMEANDLLGIAIWNGTDGDCKTAASFAQICVLESSLKVRKYYPDVKQNMDYAGTHNDVLFLELRHQGLITDAKEWRKSQEWKAWRRLFQARPDIGTMYAAMYFTRKSKASKHGIDGWVQIWKRGKVGTTHGLAYLIKVQEMRAQMLNRLCRR